MRTGLRAAGVLAFVLVMGVPPGAGVGAADAAPLRDSGRLDLAASRGLESAVAVLAARFQERHPDVNIRVRHESPRALEERARRGRDDLYLSAGAFDADLLLREGRLDAAFTKTIALDRLVLCAPNYGRLRTPLELGSPAVLRVALPDPARMPAGLMAVVALNAMGVWPAVASKAVYENSTLEVEELIATGYAEGGFLYLSDVRGTDRFRVVGTLERPYSEPIAWTAAVPVDADHPDAARAFVTFLLSEEAGEILEGMGLVRPLK